MSADSLETLSRRSQRVLVVGTPTPLLTPHTGQETQVSD